MSNLLVPQGNITPLFEINQRFSLPNLFKGVRHTPEQLCGMERILQLSHKQKDRLMMEPVFYFISIFIWDYSSCSLYLVTQIFKVSQVFQAN
jgi:hypothetical protein